MIYKVLKWLGVLLLLIVSTISLLLYQFRIEIERSSLSPEVKSFVSYPSLFEDQIYDLRENFVRDKKYMDPTQVLAAIDDASLKKIGRFPWPRKVWHDLLYKLKDYGAKIVVFDVIFSEEERYLKKENGFSPDELFAKSIKDFQSGPGHYVILPYSIVDNNDHPDLKFKEVPDSLFDFMINSTEAGELGLLKKAVNKMTYPISTLLDAKPSLGYIAAQEDPDGKFRHYSLLAGVDGIYFPSLSLQAYVLSTGDSPNLEIGLSGDAKLKLKTGTLNLNYEGESKVRWLGGMDNYPIVGISKILYPENEQIENKVKEMLKNKTVFIGSTAFGAHDFRHTPLDPKLPGVFLHMNKLSMLEKGHFHQKRDTSLLISWGLLIIGSFIMILLSFFHNAILDISWVIFFVIATLVVDYFYFMPKGYEILIFFPIVTVAGTYSWDTLINFYVANKDKQFLKDVFGNYISPELIDIMYESGQKPSLGGEEKVLTAYFTDIQSFSTFSEKLTPSELVELLNEYLTVMTDILLEEGGTLDKYEGDAIIAFFGAPMSFEDHSDRASRVAVKMQKGLLELRKKWTAEGDKWPDVVKDMRMRIGINSGAMVTGNMGSSARMNYTMMGDAVNLAARLEEAAKQYGVFTQVSQFTKEMILGDEFLWRELDTVKVVGKSEPVTTYELMGFLNEAESNLKDLKDHFEKGLELYKNEKWDEAISEFKKSLECEWKRFPELKGVKTNPSEVYIKRCEIYKETPPPSDWGGVFTLTSK
ncbi:MAG: CHASE2 domain-containing protein [Bacteriovoracaceae bacterium]